MAAGTHLPPFPSIFYLLESQKIPIFHHPTLLIGTIIMPGRQLSIPLRNMTFTSPPLCASLCATRSNHDYVEKVKIPLKTPSGPPN